LANTAKEIRDADLPRGGGVLPEPDKAARLSGFFVLLAAPC
jgi:hypothetical protein